MGVSKLPKLGLSWLWGPITLCAQLQLRWGLKQSYSPCWDISNDMLHATCMQGNRVDSWLLVVGNQIVKFTPGPSFHHNLCLWFPNGSCEPILNIHVLTGFQWYKKIFNPISFNPCICSLKTPESTKTLTPKVEVPLGVWGFILSHFPSLSGFPISLQPCKPLLWSWAQG